MPYSEWQPGISLPPPVYLDASVLAASFIANDPRYQETTQLLGDLLVSQAQIYISILTVSECLWGLAKTSYHQSAGRKSSAQFNPRIYRRNVEAIFQKYGDRMRNSVHDWLRDWRAADIMVDILPRDAASVERVSAVAPVYMQTFQLPSADAVHLATAETAAASFLTTDRDFARAEESPLQIFRVTGASATKA